MGQIGDEMQKCLEGLPPEEMLGYLESILKEDPGALQHVLSDVRIRRVLALRKMAYVAWRRSELGPSVVETLTQVAMSDQDHQAVAQAISTLAGIPTSASVMTGTGGVWALFSICTSKSTAEHLVKKEPWISEVAQHTLKEPKAVELIKMLSRQGRYKPLAQRALAALGNP